MFAIGTKNVKCRRASQRSDGFSLLELLIAISIGTIASTFAVLQVATLVKSAHINDAVQLVEKQFRSVHQRAMDTRCEYIVTFNAPGTIVIQFLQNGLLQNDSKVNLPGDEQFLLIPGVPSAPKTPDGFGTGALAIDFDQALGGGSNVLFFYPDGTVLDGIGNPNNGVLYIARPGDLYSSRAISLWGVTGRTKMWKLVSNAGVAQWQ